MTERAPTPGAAASERFASGVERPWEELGGGVRRQMLCHDEGLMMVRVRFTAGAAGALHHHPHRQVSYVESGRFEVTIAGEARTLEGGDAFIVPPDAEHGVVALDAGTLVDVFSPPREDFVR
jgi:quercetin dioxygenase-like cupin family protein